MRDRVRHFMPIAIAAVMVMAIAPAATLAQEDEPAAIEPAAINADTVDGRHAVGAKAIKKQRANKLVATNKWGMLPGNIVKPRWSLIQGMPAGFKDGKDNRGVTQIEITQVFASVYVPGDATQGVTATCETGRVVGAGFELGSQDLRINGSHPSGDSAWTVRATNDHPTSSSQLTVYAICLTTSPASALD